MFVQEEKIFAGKVLRLHICASDGAEWLEEATEDTSVEKLKERCLKHVRPARPRPAPSRHLPDALPGPAPGRAPVVGRLQQPEELGAGGETEAGHAKSPRAAGPGVSPQLCLLALGVRLWRPGSGARGRRGPPRRGPSVACRPACGPGPGSGRSCRRTVRA